MQKDVKEKIEHALRNAVKCRFDELLKYFLYLILKKDGEEKKELDEIQVKIEALQWKRYYIYEKVGNEDKSSQETRQDRSAEDFLNTTEEEKVLIMSRDDILNRLLRNTLESVQPISSDVEVNKLLITLATAFQGTKTAVWSSYVRLCNDVLDRLGNLNVNPVQCPDALNIRFQHDNCYPRVVISSTVALLNAHGDPNPDFTNPPPCQLPWQITLASNEFDVNNERYPKGVVSYLESHVFTSETRNNSLLNAVGTKAMDEEGLEGHNQIHIRPKRSRDVAALGGDEEQPSIKRTRTPSGSKGNSPKSSPTWEITVEQGTKEAKARRFECASYALDMLSYGAGIHHAINLLLTNGVLNILYCDRQGIIQSTGISIFHDFSRFLVLLLAFQRFSVKDWGIIPSLNPKAVYELYRPRPTQPSAECQNEVSPEGNREDPALPVVLRLHQGLDNPKDFANFWQESGECRTFELWNVELNMKEPLCSLPRCLSGRATTVVNAVGHGKNGTDELSMVCKVYHPEVQHRHEGFMMEVIYDVTRKDQLKALQDGERAMLGTPLNMFNHLPKIYFYGDVSGTSTHRVRSMVDISWKGHRVMRIIGMKELKKITTLKGWQFVEAWLEGHAFLWKHFIEHGDPSLSNLMYDEEFKHGVLTDFDLSLPQWEPRVVGTDRTGTIPFIALDLLTADYWSGATTRFYHHELESFIWMLPYTFLLYQDGARKSNEFVDPWRTSSYATCLKEKSTFYSEYLEKAEFKAQPDFSECWRLARSLLRNLQLFRFKQKSRQDPSEPDEEGPAMIEAGSKPRQQQQPRPDYAKHSDLLFKTFLKASRSSLPKNLQGLLAQLDVHKPGFELSDAKTQELRDRYKHILNPAPSQ